MKMTLAMIVGTRDFFPAEPVLAARRSVLNVLADLGVDAVILDEEATPMGAVETWEQAKACAALFRAHRERIDGILIVLPVFGPERAMADTIKLSGLDVPILVQAYPDDLARLDVAHRGDAFCGKISVCNNLYQYGFPFSLTEMHTVDPGEKGFEDDLRRFLGVCRVVRGLRSARIGAVGARPAIFNTVRYSEKLLQASGISVTTVDLSELFAAAGRLADGDPKVLERVEAIRAYIPAPEASPSALARMARLGIALDDWIAANELDAVAFQCWTSLQQNYGVNACTLLSMLSEKLIPAACEVDVTGVAAMYALQLASGRPSALVDWNNNYGAAADKCILFHCGNWARSFVPGARMANAEILATVLGQEATCGTVSGAAPAGPMTFARISTDDRRGCIKAYVGEGRFTADPLDTFGCRAVVEVPGLQKLLRYVCRNGFEHHAAVSASHVAAILAEALGTYLGWELYYHNGEV
ncbi:MAG: fucose isomerase [Anaerolineae bacterium]|nr:fucose isomerase [Anaerolineae bacterium]